MNWAAIKEYLLYLGDLIAQYHKGIAVGLPVVLGYINTIFGADFALSEAQINAINGLLGVIAVVWVILAKNRQNTPQTQKE